MTVFSDKLKVIINLLSANGYKEYYYQAFYFSRELELERATIYFSKITLVMVCLQNTNKDYYKLLHVMVYKKT